MNICAPLNFIFILMIMNKYQPTKVDVFQCRMFRVSLHEERRCIFHAVLHDVGGA